MPVWRLLFRQGGLSHFAREWLFSVGANLGFAQERLRKKKKLPLANIFLDVYTISIYYKIWNLNGMRPNGEPVIGSTAWISAMPLRFFRGLPWRRSRQDYGEKRLISLGRLEDIVVVIVHTARSDRTRIISRRRANQKERKAYEEKVSF
jgi:hypothetical protein